VAGFAIKASVATSVTVTMGYAWMAVQERLVQMSEEEAADFLASDQASSAFTTAFKDAWSNRSLLKKQIDDTPPDE
jgi:hypothetical protein